MPFVPPGHVNKKTLKEARATLEAADDFKECVQQRVEGGTTVPDIANLALEYIEEVTRELKPVEKELRKRWWNKVPDTVGSSLMELQEEISISRCEFQLGPLQERSDEEVERKKREAREREAREAQQALINRPTIANSDIEKKLAQEKQQNKGKCSSHSSSPFSLPASSPPPRERTSKSFGLPPPPERTNQFTTSPATRTSTESRGTPSIDVESVSQASSDRLSIHSRNTGDSNATSLKHAPHDDNAWKPGHVRQHTEAFGPDSSRSGYGHSQANIGRVAASSSSRRDSHGRHVSQSSGSHHITGNQAHAGPSNYQQGYGIQTTSSLTPQARVPHSEHSEEDTDDEYDIPLRGTIRSFLPFLDDPTQA
ncbi:hypothetical protein JB92DRAFT_3135033 [Gautieria morchelliformis]|nr:hypothetical protein JB92DRAFT_3135033 [Gautieria morchelliformis]